MLDPKIVCDVIQMCLVRSKLRAKIETEKKKKVSKNKYLATFLLSLLHL